MKTTVTIQTNIVVEFDENSAGFINLFKNFNEFFKNCDEQEFAEIIAKEVARQGVYQPIEGVGLVKVNGKMQNLIGHPVNVTLENFDFNGDVCFDAISEVE